MSQSRRRKLGDLGLTLGAVLAVVVLVAVVAIRTDALDSILGGDEVPHEFASVVYDPGEPTPDFTLTRHDGEQFTLSDLEGDIVALYFGYTHCPDICPLTLRNFAEAKKLLPEDLQDELQVVMVTADPARDTVEVLSTYVPLFDPAFIGVTGTEDELAQVFEDWRIYVEYGEPDEDGAYLVGHPAFTIILDRQGNKLLKISHLLSVAQIAEDLEAVLRG